MNAYVPRWIPHSSDVSADLILRKTELCLSKRSSEKQRKITF